ncbi:hypothetical protein NIES2135_34360 [Leptolyngbya boryana NIES-2135]|jgi:hypothetical protein|uniref:Uncharacterized protein n=1 Tax=Leptolyngbya boryana NIES-2135 TaxID=1973484 RepID=A0A1Z4JIK9_LEPBY|nr:MULTISPECIES: hypothetical protein [Leptolyngbya]BAY56602.1 hypothetical protein NIES2135_34360 [Leptolyngbya boryana NIES-2135]MBD2369904.1 hypothetical protein [Leptolyngbya sp. FACHB-161]MBD2376151.1 hypothetical protein [Leptolyngbya sp. FACHB-238]MBD2400426.1 hypothetical protein [Leptolyngbya sp. FACHB-239]MBD2406968.1 hypothetical protein [Leptolyngbya sp. FACHB-402]
MTQTNPKPDWKTRMKDGIADNDNPWLMLVAIVIFAILIALALKLIQVNLAPYIKVMGMPDFKPSNIPIVGWGYDVLTLLYVATGAVILWFLINLAQVVWILIALDRRAHRTAVRESKKEAALQGNQYESDGQVRKLKKRATRVPFFFIAASGWIALVAFVAEFLINLKAYPPIRSWNAFIAGLTIGDLSPIDMNQVMQILWGCFSTELVIIALIVVGQWIWSHKNAD